MLVRGLAGEFNMAKRAKHCVALSKRNLIYLEGLPKLSQKQKQLNEVMEDE